MEKLRRAGGPLATVLILGGFLWVGKSIFEERPKPWPRSAIDVVLQIHARNPTWAESTAVNMDPFDTLYIQDQDERIIWAGLISDYREIVADNEQAIDLIRLTLPQWEVADTSKGVFP